MGLLRIDGESNQSMERIVDDTQHTPLKRQKREDEDDKNEKANKEREESTTLVVITGTMITTEQEMKAETTPLNEQTKPDKERSKEDDTSTQSGRTQTLLRWSKTFPHRHHPTASQ